MKKSVFVLSLFAALGALLYAPHSLMAFNPNDVQKLNTTNSCVKCDLSKANLAGVDLYGADLSGADLSGADLRGTIFWDANLTDANMKGAVIDKETNFSGTKLSNTIWIDGRKCKSGSMQKCK